MKTLVRVLAQYFENYALSEGGESWKAKGGVEFNVEMDVDLLMYSKDRCTAAIVNMLAKHNNKACKYEFIDCEPVFHKPKELCTPEAFEAEILRLYLAEPVDHDEDRATQEQIDMLRDN